jgi:hypothetical protein
MTMPLAKILQVAAQRRQVRARRKNTFGNRASLPPLTTNIFGISLLFEGTVKSFISLFRGP